MFVRIIILVLLLFSVYYLGYLNCKQKNITEKINEIKYVKKEEFKILQRPNANRDELLKLMYDNRL